MKNFPETPKKRKRANSSYSSVHNKRRCHQHAVLEVNDLHDISKSPNMDKGNAEIASVNQAPTGALRNASEPVNSSAERVTYSPAAERRGYIYIMVPTKPKIVCNRRL